MPNRTPRLILVLFGLALAASPALAQFPDDGAYRPSVPISSFARPAAWLDQRLHVTAEMMVGTGFGGRGMNGLQVTRFQYRIAEPLAVQVSLGNAFGGGSRLGGAGSFFLEGFDVSYRPFQSLLVQIHYQDVRSPLQLSRSGVNPWGY